MRTSADEDRFSDLYFLLSSMDRRRIIRELLDVELRLNQVSKRLDITATEALRQLQRLTDAGFLEKIPDGKYRATPYARLILESSTATEFISKHREYFMGRDLSLIPPSFRSRLGELFGTVLLTEAVPNLNAATEVLKGAERRIDIMAEQRLEAHGQVIRQRTAEGIKVRLLLEESLLESVREDSRNSKHPPEVRSTSKICALVMLTDKDVGIGLRRLDGKMDYVILSGHDPEALGWANDLFKDQWEKAKPWHP